MLKDEKDCAPLCVWGGGGGVMGQRNHLEATTKGP